MEEGNCSKEGNKRWTEAIKGGREVGGGESIGYCYAFLIALPDSLKVPQSSGCAHV